MGVKKSTLSFVRYMEGLPGFRYIEFCYIGFLLYMHIVPYSPLAGCLSRWHDGALGAHAAPSVRQFLNYTYKSVWSRCNQGGDFFSFKNSGWRDRFYFSVGYAKTSIHCQDDVKNRTMTLHMNSACNRRALWRK